MCIRDRDNHNPYLYHAYVELKAEDGSLAEVIPYDIGFRRIEIIDLSLIHIYVCIQMHSSQDLHQFQLTLR